MTCTRSLEVLESNIDILITLTSVSDYLGSSFESVVLEFVLFDVVTLRRDMAGVGTDVSTL